MSAAVKLAIERMQVSADHQAAAHDLDPKDPNVRGLVRNVLMIAVGELDWLEDEAQALRALREALQVAIGSSCANVEAVVLAELVKLERFYEERERAERAAGG